MSALIVRQWHDQRSTYVFTLEVLQPPVRVQRTVPPLPARSLAASLVEEAFLANLQRARLLQRDETRIEGGD